MKHSKFRVHTQAFRNVFEYGPPPHYTKNILINTCDSLTLNKLIVLRQHSMDSRPVTSVSSRATNSSTWKALYEWEPLPIDLVLSYSILSCIC